MKESWKKVLVTGVAGFIGSNLADRLVKLGYEVIGVDNLSRGRRENINPKVKFYELDIRNKNIWGIMGGVDTVFHLAALARIQPSITDPLEYHDNNVNGTLNILNAAANVGVRRIVYSSSSSVYGNQKKMPEVETMLPNPLHPYGATKLIGEYYMKVWANCYKIDTVSLRYFNVYGPRQVTEGAYATVIGIFLKQKSNGNPMTIVGDGEQRRSFAYVDDVVEANIRAMTTKRKLNGEVINVGYPKSYSINEVANIIGGDKIHVKPRLFEVRETLPDIKRAYTCLAWKPKIDLREGIRRLK